MSGSDFGKYTVGDWLGTANNILLVIGTYSFVFSRKILSSKNWRMIFWIMIAYIALSAIIEFDPTGSLKKALYFLEPSFTLGNSTQDAIVALITLILIIPAYYAIYKLAYKK